MRTRWWRSRRASAASTPTTGKGKQIHLIQMLLLPFVPIMALIIQNSINMVSILEYQNDMQETIDQVQISTGLGNVTEALQSERAEIAFYLFTNGSIIRRNLSEHFAYTNSLIENLIWPSFRIDDQLFQNKILFRIRLDDFRDKITKFDTPNIEAGIAFYNRANYIFLDQLTREIKEKDASGVWRPLLAYKNMIRAIEHLGISMVFGEQYFGRGDLDQSSYIAFVTNDALGQDFLNASQNFAFWIGTRYQALQKDYPWYSNITRRRLEILGREKIQPDFEKATEYFYAMLGYLDALQKVQYEIRFVLAEGDFLFRAWHSFNAAEAESPLAPPATLLQRRVSLSGRKTIEQTIVREVQASNSHVVIGIALLAVVLIISPVIIILVRMITRTLQAFSETLLHKTHELRFEKKRSDKLLYQMLPSSVAHSLRIPQNVAAETYSAITIYFSDIVGFSEMANQSTPMQSSPHERLVTLLIPLLRQVISLMNGLVISLMNGLVTLPHSLCFAGHLPHERPSDPPSSFASQVISLMNGLVISLMNGLVTLPHSFASQVISLMNGLVTSSSLLVISLMNVLYKMFDSRIDCYDVYKIETIGDAYMVASGLHMREEGKDHAAEVAAMAIDLLHGTENFVIPHMPGERLQIRIGIHTGPAVAGVIGTKMPRYCLFGDSVNLAAKIEATGLPFKIHISQDTKDCLDRVGGFIVKLRGELEIKGRGVMDTYWLTGKHGVLPDRRRYSVRDDDEFMADKPAVGRPARRQEVQGPVLGGQQASFIRKTFNICKEFLG
nr:LOW QUALITY PROTEIN: uncharacterized protein LOC113806741 [Penaeus vannamei]